MARYACPICGDPNAYILWVDHEPPEGCPGDLSWHCGGKITIRDVTQCDLQMKRAAQRARWMKLVPDAFERDGAMKPGALVRVLEADAKANPEVTLVI